MKSCFRLHRIAALTLLCANVTSQAQTAAPLVGPAIGIAAVSTSSKVTYTSSVPSINGQSSSTSDTAISLIGSWGQVLTDRWIAMVGLSYEMGKSDLGRIYYSSGGSQNFSASTKDHLSFFLAPGYRIHPQAVMYARLSHHTLTAEYSDTATNASSRTFTGSGLGAGLAYALGQNLELRVEYDTVRYQGELIHLTTGKPEQDILTGALFYRF